MLGNSSRLLPAASGLAALLIAATAQAQVDCNQGLESLDTSAGSSMGAMDFIREVAVREVTFSKAFQGFVYTLDVNVQTVQDDKVDGEFQQLSNISYDAAGNRQETVTNGPSNTLTRAQLGDRDVEQLRDSFGVTPALLADRDVVYAGRQKIGDINTAAFDILPRNGQMPERRFAGRVWVRVSENAIIRVCGRVAGGLFDSMRYLVERTPVGDYWFPGTIRADEDVPVGDHKVHVRVAIKYTNFKAR